MKTILALVAVLFFAASASAGRPVTPSASLSASWADGRISVEGCGYISPARLSYQRPDGTTETWYIGIMGGCLDNNYILASDAGTWTITASEQVKGSYVAVAQATVNVG
jgi:hypothetical protein